VRAPPLDAAAVGALLTVACPARRVYRNVFGDPSAELRAKLDATLPVGGGSAAENAAAATVGGGAYLSRVGGFARL